MATAQGFTEVYNYSFVTEEMARAFHMDLAGARGGRQSDRFRSNAVARQPAAGDSKNILDNSRHLPAFRLFEIGREIHARNRELPEEIPHFAAAMYAREGDGRESLFELKRLAECLMEGASARLAEARPFEHPERAAIIAWRGEDVGRLFELHPALGIEGRAAILDLDLLKMEKLGVQDARRYQPLEPFSGKRVRSFGGGRPA